MVNKRLLSIMIGASLIMATSTAFAATESDNNVSMENTEKMLQKMTHQTQMLETQMTVLKSQIRQLKREQRRIEHRQLHPVSTMVVVRAGHQHLLAQPTGNTNLKGQIPPVTQFPLERVSIAPYLGDHLAFNASDLVVNYSSYNEDLALLQLRDQIYQNNPAAFAPALMFSGKVEGQAIYQKPYRGTHTSQFDLSGAEIDVIPMINQWANGFLGIKYDNSAPASGPVVSNSRVYLDRGFLTIGNLNVFPVYMTLGQTYVPFGTYSSNFIAAPLTQLMFQTKGRALILGVDGPQTHGLYGQIFAFNGDAQTSDVNNINDLGANVGIHLNRSNWNVDAGIGAIADVADSLGMQQTGASDGFTGFSETTSPFTHKKDNLRYQVPGLATHLNFGIGNFGVNAEYIKATHSFAYQDMTFDGAPARPQAVHVEGYYNFHMLNKPSAITIGMDHTWEALALNVPRTDYIANFTTSIWKDTIEQIEFNHAINYGEGDTASGSMVMLPATASGGSSNTVTAQVGVYF